MAATILIVDDDPTIRRSLTRGLEREGYAVETAGTVSTGLDALVDKSIDLILLDLHLPDGDGLGVLDSKNKAGHDQPVVMISGEGTIESAKITSSNTLERYIQEKKLQVDGIFACNLIATLGMAAALEDLRKGGIEVNAKFIGFDTSPKLIKALQEGKIDALVSQDPKKMGYLAVDTLVRHLRGKKVDEFVDTGVELVTKERLEKEKAIRQLVGLE